MRPIRYALWCTLAFAPAAWAQGPPVTCQPLTLHAGETAPVPCTTRDAHTEAYTYRWESPQHLRLLSNPHVLRPLFGAPSPLRTTYTLVVETPQGAVVQRVPLHVHVKRTEDTALHALPPAVQCAPVLHLYEGERGTLACQVTDSSPAAWRYRWEGPLITTPPDAPRTTVVAPPLVAGLETQSYPMTLAVTAPHATRRAHVTVVVHKRAPPLHCPTHLEVAPGSAVVLACHTTDTEATVRWTGLWGTATDPLSSTEVLAPTFFAPEDAHETAYHYVVHLPSHGTRHRVTVHVTGASPMSSAPWCAPLTLFEGARQSLPCHAPDGYALRWHGPQGPQAPRIAQGMLTAPPIPADTVFAYTVEACPTWGGPCLPGALWHVTVQRQKPPAVACQESHDTYAGEADLLLQCAVSGGTDYMFAWTGPDTDRLSATDVLSPTFDVPPQVEEDQQYGVTLTVTDAVIGSSSTEVHIRVNRRGQVVLDCQRHEYFVYAGSADFPLQPQCALSGAPQDGYYHRWVAPHAQDAARLTDTRVRHPTFRVPDTLAAAYLYTYTYAVGAPYADAAAVEVRVTVDPFPTAFDMTVTTAAMHFGEQAAGQQVTLDPLTGQVSSKVRGTHALGALVLASDQATEATVELAGGRLYPQDGPHLLALQPQWAVSTTCLASASEALASRYATVTLQAEEGGCRIVHVGGMLDLRTATPGSYAGTLDLTLRTPQVQETFLMPVFVTVVAPRPTAVATPRGVYVEAEGHTPVTDRQQVRIQPIRALLTTTTPYGTFTLTNPSVVTQEISVQAVFGYTAARGDQETIVPQPTEAVGDLGAALLVYPTVLTLSPGETRYVHYALREDQPLPEKAHATFLEFSSRPRRFVPMDRLPTPDDATRVAHVTLRIQSAYIPAPGGQVAVTPLDGDRLRLEAVGGPFAGAVVATDAQGNELARRELLLLTTRILAWPLPTDTEVTLHFITSHATAPPPVTLRR